MGHGANRREGRHAVVQRGIISLTRVHAHTRQDGKHTSVCGIQADLEAAAAADGPEGRHEGGGTFSQGTCEEVQSHVFVHGKLGE